MFAGAYQSTYQLVDRGANGVLASADMRILQKSDRKINFVGVDDHELNGLDVVTAAALFDTQKGPVIGIFHEYAHLGKGRSIYAAGKMEWFNCKVHDRSKVVGGTQRIETADGYVFPLSIESGLVYMHYIQVPTDDDLGQYPHVFFTSPDIFCICSGSWHYLPFLSKFTKKLMTLCSKIPYLRNVGIFTNKWYSTWMFSGIQTLQRLWSILFMPISTNQSNPVEEDWKSLRPCFGWQYEQLIQDTYKPISRFGGTVPQHDYLKKHFKSRNPVFNIPRRNEPVATDTFFSDTPAINDGSTMAQFFVGKDT